MEDVWISAIVWAREAGARIVSAERREETGEMLLRLGESLIRLRVDALTPASSRLTVLAPGPVAKSISDHVQAQAEAQEPKGNIFEGIYPAPFERCLEAACRAMDRLAMPFLSFRKGAGWVEIDSRTAQGVPVWTLLRRESEAATKVKIAVGKFPSMSNWRASVQIKAVFDELLARGAWRN